MKASTQKQKAQLKSYERDYVKLKKEMDNLFKPSKEDIKIEIELKKLEKENQKSRTSNINLIKQIDKKIENAEKLLAKAPGKKKLKNSILQVERARDKLINLL